MIEQEQFSDLEKLTTELRAKKLGFYSGYSDLSRIYGYLDDETPDDRNFQRTVGKLEKWAIAYPESPTPRIMLGEVYVSWAWKARGSGYANTVTKEGWQLFGDRLNRARTQLEAADGLTTKDPETYRTMMTVALGQGWSKEEMDTVFKKGVSVEPNYMQLYESKANFLLPRWHGEPGDWETFAAAAADARGGEEGDILYMCIARSVSWTERAEFYDNTSASYDRMKRGFEASLKRHPTYSYDMNSFCYFACIAGDRTTAKDLFQRINGQWEESVWREKDYFDQWQRWAVNNVSAPLNGTSRSRPPVMTPQAFKKILLVGGIIWFFVIAVVGGIIWAVVRRYQESD